MNQQTKTSNEQKNGDSTTSKNLGPWTQPPRKINVEDLAKELLEIKNKRKEFTRIEKELLIKLKTIYEETGLEEFEDGEDNRFQCGDVLITKRVSIGWTYSPKIKAAQIEEQKSGLATEKEIIKWIIAEAEE